MDIKYTSIEIQNVVTAIEQRIAAGEDFTGAAPALGATTFIPWVDTIDNVFRYASPADHTIVQGDAGGLFQWIATKPVSVEFILADFGSVGVTYTMSILTATSDDVTIATATGQYLIRKEVDRFYLFPGDKLKFVTSGGTNAMVLRIGVTLATGTH